jgi:ATP-binding cassette subfamily F protein uup
VKALSGGERNRLLLARLFLQAANVLVLDEPTNDLDLVTLNVLERLLLDFDGSVLLVTHDRYFLDKVATAILAFDGGGRITRWEGNYDTYRRLKDQLEAETRRTAEAGGGSAPKPSAPVAAPARAQPRKPGKLSFKEQRELEGIEAAILTAEERKAELEAALGDPATYQKDGGAVAGLRAELEKVSADVEHLYARWQELEGFRGGAGKAP